MFRLMMYVLLELNSRAELAFGINDSFVFRISKK